MILKTYQKWDPGINSSKLKGFSWLLSIHLSFWEEEETKVLDIFFLSSESLIRSFTKKTPQIILRFSRFEVYKKHFWSKNWWWRHFRFKKCGALQWKMNLRTPARPLQKLRHYVPLVLVKSAHFLAIYSNFAKNRKFDACGILASLAIPKKFRISSFFING